MANRSKTQVSKGQPSTSTPQTPKRIGEMLIEEGLITPDQLNRALEEQKFNPLYLGVILMRKRWVKEEDLFRLLAIQRGLEFFDLKNKEIPAEVVEKIPPDLALSHQVLPVELEEGTLKVAAEDPLSQQLVSVLSQVVPEEIKPGFATRNELHFAIQRAYNSLVRANPLVRDFFDGAAYLLEQPQLDANRLVDLILALGHLLGASHIHITYAHQELRLSIRTEGILHIVPFPARRFTPEQSLLFRTTLKQRSGLNFDQLDQAQEGLITLGLTSGTITARVQYLPLTVGEKFTLEMIEDFQLRQWEDLGWEMGWGTRILDIISLWGGLILIMGRPKSGRTSTLYSLLNHLSRSKGDLVLVGNRLHHPLAGVAQIALREEETPRDGLSILERLPLHDPDIVAVDDISSPQMLKATLELASSGPLVIGVVPQGDVLYGLLQLLSWGIDPVLLASVLRVVISQRLTAQICPHCREEIEDLTPYKRYTQVRLAPPLYVARGCRHCYFTGREGRVALFEVLIPDETFREALIANPTYTQLRNAALKSSWYTFSQDALQKAHQGKIDLRTLIALI